jgi:transcriptional regulator with XRE-family HTH domain
MLNDALRLIRVYHDLSQQDVAKKVGLSKSYVSELEAGNKRLTLDVLGKYAHAFDMPISSLMLFAERTEEKSFAEDARLYIANTTLKMLDWIATISKQHTRRGRRA